jgi:isopentenyl diphosphate isomerase/L-lactate dehydrogenase-like FMN-dependent dehydrogenase
VSVFVDAAASRRNFLHFLAAGTALTYTDALAFADTLLPKAKLPDPIEWAPLDANNLIKTPRDALSVFDFEPVARQTVLPAHFGYMASGIDDEATLRANREGFLKFQLRPRRLVNVSKIDMKTNILGATYNTPIVLAPCSSQKAYHPEGEIAVARAARTGNHLQILSTLSDSSIEDVAAARGQPIWFQLYASDKWEVTEKLVKRAENAGCPAVAVTVDLIAGRNLETRFRLSSTDTHQCGNCHDNSSLKSSLKNRPMLQDIDFSSLSTLQASSLTWDFMKRLRDATKMKILIKGVLASEDAKLAVSNGLDAIIVSNHGGRSEDAGRSTIDTLPEIVEVVGGRVPILIDSGFRRGTDIAKALCLGATAVCVGRPYLWGLGAFGEPGVARVLELLHVELVAIMQQLGAPSIKDLTPAMVRRA